MDERRKTDEPGRSPGVVSEVRCPARPVCNVGRPERSCGEPGQKPWLALVTGPEIEETVWKGLRDTARPDDDLIEALKPCYEEKMKPVVSGEQLAALRQRYKVGRKT
jgi:hypothetical protein